MWTVLVQTVGINFSAIVAVNHGGGQKLGPSIDLLAKMLWISYLVLYYYSRGYHTGPKNSFWTGSENFEGLALLLVSLIALCALGMVKITLKLYAFEKARRSLALGRNARLVAGYMEKLRGRPNIISWTPETTEHFLSAKYLALLQSDDSSSIPQPSRIHAPRNAYTIVSSNS